MLRIEKLPVSLNNAHVRQSVRFVLNRIVRSLRVHAGTRRGSRRRWRKRGKHSSEEVNGFVRILSGALCLAAETETVSEGNEIALCFAEQFDCLVDINKISLHLKADSKGPYTADQDTIV